MAIVAAVGAPVAVYQRGVDGLLVVIAISTVFSLLWFLAKAGDESPVLNAGVTMLSVAYIGVLGSYGALMLHVLRPLRHRHDSRGGARHGGYIDSLHSLEKLRAYSAVPFDRLDEQE